MRKLTAATAFAATATALAGLAQAQTAPPPAPTAPVPMSPAPAMAPVAGPVMATVTTDLNVRSGPGTQHGVTGSLASGADVTVNGCITAANWCEVVSGATTGWADGEYLTPAAGAVFADITPPPPASTVTVIETQPVPGQPGAGQNAAVGGLTGAAMGAVIAGPVGALVGAGTGGMAGGAATPDPQIETYVTTHVVDPVMLEGEVSVGAGVPEGVILHEIPDYPDYRYAVINNQTVLLNPTDRRIVYVYR